MRLLAWSAARLLSAAVTLLGVSVLIFGAMRAMPGGFAAIVLGPLASPEQRAELTARFGLNDPVLVQYGHWIQTAFGGDFGRSLVSNEPVTAELGSRLPVTLQLTLMAAIPGVLIGAALGVLIAVRCRSRGGALGRIASALGVNLPEYVVGGIAVYFFSRYYLGLTVGGYVPFGEDPVTNLAAMVLPAGVLAVFVVSATARTTRDAVLNVLHEPYITTAVSRGQSPWSIIRRHVLRNAAIPVLVVASTVTAYLLGGAVIVEYLFNPPGVGSYVVQAITRRDYAVVQAGVLLAAALFILTNMVVDLLVGAIDPRLGVSSKGGRG
ncbi:ABC transporter permease [Acrocarpospora corrugata]|uniref:ABC transporter permease n=1 Tax=Acrocarpospora corrugata TaxID=35763 RepID=A0A5M3W7M6_9ACTN|nr:ABC transporter permease [Acrocarpospora corrugata]GES04806.1 ABC transporter permease [Acrocarpospora corrugata]